LRTPGGKGTREPRVSQGRHQAAVVLGADVRFVGEYDQRLRRPEPAIQRGLSSARRVLGQRKSDRDQPERGLPKRVAVWTVFVPRSARRVSARRSAREGG